MAWALGRAGGEGAQDEVEALMMGGVEAGGSWVVAMAARQGGGLDQDRQSGKRQRPRWQGGGYL